MIGIIYYVILLTLLILMMVDNDKLDKVCAWLYLLLMFVAGALASLNIGTVM